jgi:hypothetical protein
LITLLFDQEAEERPSGGAVAGGVVREAWRVSRGVRTRRMITRVDGGGSGVAMRVMAIEGPDPAA